MSATAKELQARVEDESLRRESWSLSRWVLCVIVAFAVHIGLIFVFGNRKPVVARPVANAPQLKFTDSRSELQTLADPTLFALPHPRGFAAAAWRQLPRVEFAPFRWSEPPQLLDLPVAKLGSAFLKFAQTNAVPTIEVDKFTPVQTMRVGSQDQSTSLKQHSTLTANGRIAKRRWLNPPALLQSWPASDLLTNSVVRIVVDTDGQVFSPALLPPGSGSKAADQYALEIARSARFAPIPRNTTQQMVGTLTFEWHVVPMPETNAAPVKP